MRSPDRIRVLLLDGRLGSGARLPAERELSQALDVSRTTVAAAYAQLRDDGYLVSVRGSGSTIALPGGQRGTQPWGADLPLDFTKATSPAYPGLAAAYQQAAEEVPRYLGHHGFDMTGLPELREAIAQGYRERGLATTPDQIMVTMGAQHALSLLTQTLYSPGERILVEQPTYPHALDTFAAAGARMLPVPVTAEDGWNMAEAQLLIRRAAPSLGYLMPDFHNPTGMSMTPADRERLALLAQREGTTLVGGRDHGAAGHRPRRPAAAGVVLLIGGDAGLLGETGVGRPADRLDPGSARAAGPAAAQPARDGSGHAAVRAAGGHHPAARDSRCWSPTAAGNCAPAGTIWSACSARSCRNGRCMCPTAA